MNGGMMPMGMGPMGMGPGGRQPFQHIEGQIAFFKAELKVTDAQAPQWNAFADALRASAVRLREAMARATEARDPLSAPEQMERRFTASGGNQVNRTTRSKHNG